MKMKINDDLLRQIESDLSLNIPYIKGKDNPIRNCWHFCTDGNAVDRLFDDREDFINGMNRIFIVSVKYHIVILAFCLMDTHVHFILYGKFDQCNKFMHDYVRLTSINIFNRHKESHKLLRVPITHQYIDNEFYLKIAICYVLKNPPVGGICYNAYDYPWGSAALYFRNAGEWCSPDWTRKEHTFQNLDDMSLRCKRKILKNRNAEKLANARMFGQIIFPGEYVAYEIVEKLFKTHKSFNYFLCKSKEEDVESKGGELSRLSIPMQEMRQHRNEICQELFQANTIRTLDTQQRLKLARTLRKRFNSSPKQICRLCGLILDEVKSYL